MPFTPEHEVSEKMGQLIFFVTQRGQRRSSSVTAGCVMRHILPPWASKGQCQAPNEGHTPDISTSHPGPTSPTDQSISEARGDGVCRMTHANLSCW